jgi:hypothetical protein
MVLPIETPICGPRWLLNVTLGNVCFEAYYGLKSDIAPCPKSANNGSEPALLAAPEVVYSSTSCQWDVPEFCS